MRTLALILPNWIGDAVMATPAIRAVRYQFPNSRLVAVGKPAILETLAGTSWLDHAIPFDKKKFFWTLALLRQQRPDTAILFPNSFRSALFARFAGCRTIVGFARYFRDALLTHRLYPRRGADGKPKPHPIIKDYNRLALRLGTPDPGHQLELATTDADITASERLWRSARLDRFASVVGLNPGGAFGASKHWPTAYFAELANRLAVRGHGVIVLCGPAERDEAIRIAAEARHPHVISATSQPSSVGLTKALVRRLALLITTDSGPRHFAAAFNVPVVTLFGPTHIAWTETFFARAVHLQEKLPCGPCQQRVCPLGHHDCMKQLTPAKVLVASVELLRQAGGEVRRAG